MSRAKRFRQFLKDTFPTSKKAVRVWNDEEVEMIAVTFTAQEIAHHESQLQSKEAEIEKLREQSESLHSWRVKVEPYLMDYITTADPDGQLYKTVESLLIS